MYSIENQYLKVVVSSLGAELQNIFDKEMKQEVLWQGDKKYWGRRAPVLFPECHFSSSAFFVSPASGSASIRMSSR